MKKLLFLFGVLLISTTSFSQTMEKDYVNFLLDDYSAKPKIQPFEWRMFPKPESIEKKGNKVIVIFDRKEFERFQYMRRRSHMHRVREFQNKKPISYPQKFGLK